MTESSVRVSERPDDSDRQGRCAQVCRKTQHRAQSTRIFGRSCLSGREAGRGETLFSAHICAPRSSPLVSDLAPSPAPTPLDDSGEAGHATAIMTHPRNGRRQSNRLANSLTPLEVYLIAPDRPYFSPLSYCRVRDLGVALFPPG